MTDRATMYVRLTLPEDYEDVHPDLVLEDFMDGDGAAFEPQIVDMPALLARAEAAERLLRESRDLWPVLAVSPFRGEEEVTLDRVVAHRQRVAALLEKATP